MNAIEEFPDANQMGLILAHQRAAFLRDGAPSLAERRASLAKLKQALIDRRAALEAAISSDFGHRAQHETAIMEVFGVAAGIDYLSKNLRRFMRPERRHVSLLMQFGRAWIEYQPLGVVGVISPWNYPILVPVTLELGGKSPAIVAKGGVQDRFVSDIVWGKLLSGGQTCIAPDYALVHESEVDTFVASFDRLAQAAYPDGPTSEDYTSIVNDRQYGTLIDLIEDARARGARIIEVGHRPGDAARRPHTLAPTVVLGVTDEMKIAHQEIFGPILPIFPYRDIDEAIAYVNARPRPLALYYFGRDDADRRKVLDRTTSGNVTVNGTIMHVAQDDLPFGGVGASGIGAYHGVEGFRRLSHAKGIYEQGRWNAVKLFHPPYGKLVERILNLMLR
ncbi:aldehyde dehydrogenase family protein [Rhizobium ecuadorense]|uniref:aldehyde dehydrogenase family protein n=1 Tax=Rhizobium ecuadorense TaxID=1671795 RepID=UPI0006733582|nr:aldehyde dehydrogenase family protein [Rhizobium ecuadorense]